jgi:nitrite reductase (NADH) small subunit
MSIIMPRDKVVYNLGPIERIPLGEGRPFRIEDTMIAIFRTRKNEVFATQTTCPHKGGPLADGILGDGKIVCPLHMYKFQLATGEALGHTCGALTTYPVSLDEDENILLYLEV